MHNYMQKPPQELIVWDKSFIRNLLVVVILGFWTVNLSLGAPAYFSDSIFAGSFFWTLLQLGALSLFSLCFIVLISRRIRNPPIAILNNHGLWLEHYHPIEWSNIEIIEATMLGAYRGGIWGLAIRFKNPELVLGKTWLSRKKLSFAARRSSYYHVMPTNHNVNYRQIERFAHQFLDQKL